MKVKIFNGYTEKGLSKKKNRFLDSNSVEVIDIKFSAAFFYMGAMVIYKTTN